MRVYTGDGEAMTFMERWLHGHMNKVYCSVFVSQGLIWCPFKHTNFIQYSLVEGLLVYFV